MQTETPDYHREWIERIRANIAELEKVLQNHKSKLAEALEREQVERK